MARNLNRWEGIGHLGADPEIRYTTNGDPILSINIACGDDYTNKETGQKVERTEWVRLVAYNRLAEVIGQYCHKGSKLYVSGKLTTRKWQDKDGQDRYTTEIRVTDFEMLDKREDNGFSDQARLPDNSQQAQERNHRRPPASVADLDDDIPF